MIDNIKNKIDVRLDYVQPITIGNFCNNHTALCKDLMGEAGAILYECGWEHEFTIYYYGDFRHVRLYLRLAYVAACHLDGLWEDIKIRLPDIIPLVKSAMELRKEKKIHDVMDRAANSRIGMEDFYRSIYQKRTLDKH